MKVFTAQQMRDFGQEDFVQEAVCAVPIADEEGDMPRRRAELPKFAARHPQFSHWIQ